MQAEPVYYDDEIDLRELVLTLISGWKTVLLMTLLAGFVAFALSKWVLPEKYQAKAYITISEPTIQFAETEKGITVHSSLPDMKSVAELAMNPALLEKVTTTSEVALLWDAEKDVFDDMIEAVSVGNDQLRLEVSDSNPERAALLVDTWAGLVTLEINKLYGIVTVAEDIDNQVLQAEESYAEAQRLLEEELAQNEQALLDAQLASAKEDLGCILARSSAATRILEDLKMLESSIEKQGSDLSLSLGDALSLTTLQQRISASQICASSIESIQLQVADDTLNQFTVREALEKISQMQESLQIQQPNLLAEETRLEVEIPSLERDLEAAQYALNQRMETRDQAEELYVALLQHQSRIKSILMTSDRVATLSAQAVIPNEPGSPKTLMNTALGLVSGGLLGVFWVFAVAWWQGSEEEEDKKDLRRI